MPPLPVVSLCRREIRRQRCCRGDVREAAPLHHVGDTALINLEIRRDPRIVVFPLTGQLDHRNHVRREFFVLHIKPFSMQDRKAVDGFIVMNHSDSVEAKWPLAVMLRPGTIPRTVWSRGSRLDPCRPCGDCSPDGVVQTRVRSGRSSYGGGGKTVIYGGAQIGDLVQWDSNGALQFEQPRRVRQISTDGNWIAVEGSETGLPMSEVIVEQKASRPAADAPKFPIGSAEPDAAVWIRNEVGPETKVIISVIGEMGPREIGKLIRLLEAQKAVLED